MKIALEQWRALIAVVDAGGYAQAAAKLHKSQSAVTYAVQKLETLLGVQAFEIQGRKAVLTPTGQMLYRRAHALVEEAASLERAATKLSAGWEPEIRVAAEIIFPTRVLLEALARFGAESPGTRIELIESVLGGTPEALLTGQADLAISPQTPPGFLGDSLARLRFVCCAAPRHPLFKLKRKVTTTDLRKHRHLVVRDSGTKRDRKAIFLEADQRWTFGHLATSIQAAKAGHGYAWYPEEKVRDELERGELAPLPLREGAERFAEVYLILADREFAGPGVQRLAALIRETTGEMCATKGG
jgi:DNA-binding transcriptional LysR family regulator